MGRQQSGEGFIDGCHLGRGELGGGMHFHAGQGEKMKRDERQTTRGTHIYGPKRGKRYNAQKKKKGEDPKERLDI